MPLVSATDPAAKDGKVHSHRFPGANTALPFVNRDDEQMQVTQAFLKSGAVTIDVFGLVPESRTAARAGPGGEPRLSTTFAAGEESMSFGAARAFVAPAARWWPPSTRWTRRCGAATRLRLDVVVRTRRVGHFFPGGTVDAFDVWVELEVVDSNGKKIFHSGSVATPTRGRAPSIREPISTGAWSSTSTATDQQAKRLVGHAVPAYARLVPPGAADTGTTAWRSLRESRDRSP